MTGLAEVDRKVDNDVTLDSLFRFEDLDSVFTDDKSRL